MTISQLCSIVGFSGSGKSTLIALLVRLHDPDEGRILINGVDIKRYDSEDLYRNIRRVDSCWLTSFSLLNPLTENSFLFQETRERQCSETQT